MFPPLVSADRLRAELGTWVVVDATADKTSQPDASIQGYQAFLAEGHIPGARFGDLVNDFSDPGGEFPFTRPSARQFETAASRLGISDSEQIAVYDRSNGIWAARLWWLFRSFGHDKVAVLDGGLDRWNGLGFPLERDARPYSAGKFVAQPQDGYFVSKTFVKDVVEEKSQATLVNVLRRPVFAGSEQNYARPGHIPSSLNIPYKELIDPASNTLLPESELSACFGDIGEGDQLVVTYCGGGITAAGSALALAVLGRENVAVYDGSLNEWSADLALPMVTLA
jgi:thiosulfate/3-mercaptopyruvate sulfurtransferase